MTVEELLTRISSSELAEWAAFEQEFGPIGLERGDYQAAVAAYASVGNPKAKLEDFLLSWGRRRSQSGQEQLNILKAMAGGK